MSYNIGIASRTTLIEFSSDGETVQLVDGEPIYVWGVIFNNAYDLDTTTIIQMQDRDSSPLMEIVVNGLENLVFNVPFVADNGLQFKLSDVGSAAATQISVTIHHSHPGS